MTSDTSIPHLDAAAGAAAFDLPEDLRLLRETTRRFMRNEVGPVEDRVPYDAYKVPAEDLARLREKARALGLWFVQSPARWGGAGLGVLGQCVVAEEAAQCRMGAYTPACDAFGYDLPNIVYRGTEAQIERYAVPTIERGERTFVAISEPSGGADPARAIRTRAERRGDRYVVNGTKLWITSARDARWGVLFARTDRSAGRGGVTAFIVETGWPGLTMRDVPVIRSYYPSEMVFVDYEVPVENRLGEEGQGFELAEEWLVHARMPYAAGTVGIAQAALDLAIDWARERETFGSRLADKQAVQWMLADSEIELRASRALIRQAAAKADRGENAKVEASVCKVYATETAGRVVDRCIQILGGLGVSREMPLERWYRELRIKRIGEGPSEVHRMVVARELLGGRRRGS